VEKSGEKIQYFTAFTSLRHQPSLQISKGDLELKKGIQLNQPFPLNSYPKVICMVYSKQIPTLNILIHIDLLITVKKVKKAISTFFIYNFIYFLNFILEMTFVSILINHFTK
jgi:hypothetical protein